MDGERHHLLQLRSLAWSRDTVFAGSLWAAGGVSSLADTLVSYGDAAATVDEEEDAFFGKTAASSPSTVRLPEQLLLEAELLRHSNGLGLGFAAMDDGAAMLGALEPCAMPLTDGVPPPPPPPPGHLQQQLQR